MSRFESISFAFLSLLFLVGGKEKKCSSLLAKHLRLVRCCKHESFHRLQEINQNIILYLCVRKSSVYILRDVLFVCSVLHRNASHALEKLVAPVTFHTAIPSAFKCFIFLCFHKSHCSFRIS